MPIIPILRRLGRRIESLRSVLAVYKFKYNLNYVSRPSQKKKKKEKKR
jgi:hypothetical protein